MQRDVHSSAGSSFLIAGILVCPGMLVGRDRVSSLGVTIPSPMPSNLYELIRTAGHILLLKIHIAFGGIPVSSNQWQIADNHA